MFSSAFLLNNEGKLLLEKRYLEEVDSSLVGLIADAVQQEKSDSFIFSKENSTVIGHLIDHVWFCGVFDGDDSSIYCSEIVKSLGKKIKSLLNKELTPELIENSNDTVCRILDLYIDASYPFIDEENALSSIIDFQKRNKRPVLNIATPWRKLGVDNDNNLFIDMTETIDVTVSENGKILFEHVVGDYSVLSHLSDVPVITFHLDPKTVFDDVTFHRSVEFKENNYRTLICIPPDGRFELLRYHLFSPQCELPLFIVPKFTWNRTNVTFEISLKPSMKLVKPLDNVEIIFEMPRDVYSVNLQPSYGDATFVMKTNEVKWYFDKYSGHDEIKLEGSASLPSNFVLIHGQEPVVYCNFKTFGFIPSNLKLASVDVEHVEYKEQVGVKYITKAGNFEFHSHNVIKI